MFYLSTTAFSAPQLLASLRGLACTLALSSGLVLNFFIADRHDGQRYVEVLALLVAALVFVLRGGRYGILDVAGRPVQLAALAFFTLGLLSTFAATSLRHALFEWSSLLLLVMLGFCVAAEIAAAGRGALECLLWIVGATCLLYSLRILLFYMAALASAYPADMHELAIGFSNVRFLNHTQTALLPLLALLCLQAPARSALRRTWFCLAAFWWTLLYVSQARASLLALLAGCTVLLLLRQTHARSFLKIMGWTALGGCLIYLLGFVLLPILVGLPPHGSATNALLRTAADPASGRLFLWTRALGLIAHHPWFGVGPLHFAHYGADLQVGAHPHNWVVQVAAEWGIPALLCILFIAGSGIHALRRAGQRIAPGDVRNQQLLSAFMVASLAILVDGLFSGVFVMPQSRLAIALVLGCAAGWVGSLKGHTVQGNVSAGVRAGVVVAALAAACALVYSVAPDAMARARSAPPSAAEKAGNPGSHWPRMWETGYF